MALTLEVERCCPVSRAFQVEGVGEGIVWVVDKSDGTQSMFKVKGDQHKNMPQ